MQYKKNPIALVLLLSFFITACGEKKESAPVKSDSQVVAKVNGDEILIHQINFQLARMGQLNEEQSKLAAKQIIQKLVEQQLLKRQAIDAKLDRDPNVLLAIESAKDAILSQAYLEQVLQKANKPSAAELDSFYESHPELFSERRVFRLQEIVVDVPKDKFSEVESKLKEIKGINNIATWLKDNNFVFSVNSNVRPAEQLPLEMLKKLQPLKADDFLIVPTDKSLNVVHIAAIQPVPVTKDKAAPIIEQYFLNQNKAVLAKSEMKKLYEAANIEFVGAFSDMKKQNLMASSEKTSNTSLPKNEKVEKQVNEPKAEKKEIEDSSNLDKGLSGL